MKDQFTLSTLIEHLKMLMKLHGDIPICCHDGNEEMSPFDENGIILSDGEPESDEPHLRVDHLEFF